MVSLATRQVQLGSDYQDALDFCDTADDTDSIADNCITFDGVTANEGGTSASAAFSAGTRN